MCKASFLLQDPPSVACYLHLAKIWMKETTSLAALSAASGRVVGVALTTINSQSEKTDTYARVQVSNLIKAQVILDGGESCDKLLVIISERLPASLSWNSGDFLTGDSWLG